MVVRDKRLESEWLAQGKYHIGVGMDNKVVADFIEIGAPFLQIVPKEGAAMTSTGQIVVFKQAPHPNAAKIFINWLLSKEAQSFYPGLAGFGSRRKDISNDWLPAFRKPQPGIPYSREDEEYYTGTKEQHTQQVIAIYKAYLAR